jgi:cytochrome c peroxidase
MRYKAMAAGALAILALVVLWQATRAVLGFESAPLFAARSFHPAPGDEPIVPIPRTLPLDERKVALGRRLFHDPRLSADNSIACASCHALSKGGVDGSPQSVGIRGQRGAMNAPTVFNSVFNFRQFWDGRAATLEDQVDGPVHNPLEMASDWPAILVKLAADPGYRNAFRGIYPDGMQPANIKNAIAEFERSLTTPDSRFDRYLAGDRSALTWEEVKGYQLFKNYGCIACHQGVNVGGNVYERLGVMERYFPTERDAKPADIGRMAITGRAEDRHVFKVPSLRNVALTGPYFHDGSVATLEQAVSIMGRFQLGVSLPPEEVALIVKFLQTLTGRYAGELQ